VIKLEKDWRTDDIGLAAYISEMMETDPDVTWEGSKCYFHFERTEQLGKYAVAFATDEAVVNPRSFGLAHNRMKKLMFEHPSSPAGTNKFPKKS